MSCRGKDGGAGGPGVPGTEGGTEDGKGTNPQVRTTGDKGDMKLGGLPMEEYSLEIILLETPSGAELYA